MKLRSDEAQLDIRLRQCWWRIDSPRALWNQGWYVGLSNTLVINFRHSHTPKKEEISLIFNSTIDVRTGEIIFENPGGRV